MTFAALNGSLVGPAAASPRFVSLAMPPVDGVAKVVPDDHGSLLMEVLLPTVGCDDDGKAFFDGFDGFDGRSQEAQFVGNPVVPSTL